MTRQHQQLIEKCQDISSLALTIAYNSELKPALDCLSMPLVDELIQHLNADIKDMTHIIGLQMKYDESSI